MIDIGVASPSAHGQAMMSTRHRRDHAVGEARLRSENRPAYEGKNSHGDHRRHEVTGDTVGEPLDRCAAPLRLRDELHDPLQERVAADLLRLHDEARRSDSPFRR